MKISSTSERLLQIMNNRHLKQVDILRLAAPFCEENDIKLNRSDLSQYVSGKVEPRQSKLYILGQALKVNEAWLMGYDVPMHQKGIVEPNSSSQIKVPVLGTVRAGLPMEAVENILDYEEISEDMARQGDYFALQIKGDSMEPRIKEGDVVIVRKQPDVESGEVAIVLVNGDEATIKKVQKFNGGINLVPSNPAYEVKTYSNDDIESLPVSIIGKVVELRAKF